MRCEWSLGLVASLTTNDEIGQAMISAAARWLHVSEREIADAKCDAAVGARLADGVVYDDANVIEVVLNRLASLAGSVLLAVKHIRSSADEVLHTAPFLRDV